MESMDIEYVRRNHICSTDNAITYDYIHYSDGDGPVSRKTLTRRSTMCHVYHPKFKVALDSNKFWTYTNFIDWMNAQMSSHFPSLLYGMPACNTVYLFGGDPNAAEFYICHFSTYVYYKFAFSGINNLDVQ